MYILTIIPANEYMKLIKHVHAYAGDGREGKDRPPGRDEWSSWLRSEDAEPAMQHCECTYVRFVRTRSSVSRKWGDRGGHLSSVSVGKLSSTSIVALGAPPPVLCHEEGPLNFSLSSFLHGDTKDTISSASCCHFSLSLSMALDVSIVVPIPCNKHSSFNLTKPSSLNRIKRVLGPIERLQQSSCYPLLPPVRNLNGT
jgi:hypothetical protein